MDRAIELEDIEKLQRVMERTRAKLHSIIESKRDTNEVKNVCVM